MVYLKIRNCCKICRGFPWSKWERSDKGKAVRSCGWEDGGWNDFASRVLKSRGKYNTARKGSFDEI